MARPVGRIATGRPLYTPTGPAAPRPLRRLPAPVPALPPRTSVGCPQIPDSLQQPHVLFYRRDPLGTLERWGRRYGKLAHYQPLPAVIPPLLPGMKANVFVNDPHLVGELFVDKNACFARDLLSQMTRVYVGDSVFTTAGERWRELRRQATPPLQPKQTGFQAEIMAEHAALQVAGWHSGAALEVLPAMVDLTLPVLFHVLFNIDARQPGVELPAAAALAQFNREVTEIMRWLPVPNPAAVWRLARARRQVLRQLTPFVQQRRQQLAKASAAALASPQFADMLSQLILQADHPDAPPASNTQLIDSFLTMVTGGFETTSLTLTWALALLAADPQAQDEVAADARDPAGGALVRATVREVLRLRPTVWVVPRYCIAPCTIGSARLTPGMTAFASPWVMHHRADLYPEPQRFDVHRFAGAGEADLLAATREHRYFPFGGGPRVCIGRFMAEAQVTAALRELLRRWRFLPTGPVPPPQAGFTLAPREPVVLRLQRRE